MSPIKTKILLATIWVGVLTMMGASEIDSKSLLDWLTWALHAGLLAALAVALRHYYRQIKVNAVWEERRNMMWSDFIKRHQLNGEGLKDDDK